ncbi:MAG: hypothetical protein AAFW75_04265 [Cyanobacteria bacterium J06636_16]
MQSLNSQPITAILGALLLGLASYQIGSGQIDPGREGFREINRPPNSGIGIDPEAIAQSHYGGYETAEGN